MGKDTKTVRWVGLALAVVGGLLIIKGITDMHVPLVLVPVHTWTPEPIVPTRTPVIEQSLPPTMQSGPVTDRSWTPVASPSPTVVSPSGSGGLTSPMDVALTETPPSAGMDAGSVRTGAARSHGSGHGRLCRYLKRTDGAWACPCPMAQVAMTLAELRVGWVMDWNVRGSVALPDGVEYAQTVRMEADRCDLRLVH